MGFATSFLAGAQAAEVNRNSDRKDRQDEFTRLKEGYKTGENGSIVPTSNKQAELDMKLNQMASMVATQNAYIAEQSAKENKNTLKTFIDNWYNDNPNDAIKAFKENKNLVEKLKNPALNMHGFRPVNLKHDQELLSKMGLDFMDDEDGEINVNDPHVSELISSNVIMIQGENGEWRPELLDNLSRQTNNHAYMTKEERIKYEERTKYFANLANEKEKKPLSMSEQATAFKLGGDMATKSKKDYVLNNRDNFNKVLRTGDKNADIGGATAYDIATVYQGDNKPDTNTMTQLNGTVSTIKSFQEVSKLLADPKLDYNMVAKFMSAAKKAGGDLIGMSKEQLEMHIKKIGLDTKKDLATLSLIKAMSGLTVSDRERSIYSQALLSGNWADKTSAQAALQASIESLAGSAQDIIGTFIHDYPRTYLDRYEDLKVLNRSVPGLDKPKTAADFD